MMLAKTRRYIGNLRSEKRWLWPLAKVLLVCPIIICESYPTDNQQSDSSRINFAHYILVKIGYNYCPDHRLTWTDCSVKSGANVMFQKICKVLLLRFLRWCPLYRWNYVNLSSSVDLRG